MIAVLLGATVTASQAQAGHVTWEAGATKFVGEAEGSQVFSTTAGEIICNELSAEINLEGLGESAETLTTENLKYDNNGTGKCKSNISGFEPKLEMNGCTYTVHLGETNELAGTLESTFDITCPEAKAIVVNGGFICSLSIGSQTGLGGETVHKELNLTFWRWTKHTTKELSYSHEGLCGNGSSATGSYTGNISWMADSGNVSAT